MHSQRVPGSGAGNGAWASSGPGRLVTRVVCAVVACAVGVALGLSVNRDLRATASIEKPRWVRGVTRAYRQEECIYHAIQSELPQGASVYIGVVPVSLKSAPGPAEQWMLWDETRLTEWSTPWAVPRPSPAAAQWTLSLVHAPGHCHGLALEVRRT
jgi:hypothetical protein